MSLRADEGVVSIENESTGTAESQREGEGEGEEMAVDFTQRDAVRVLLDLDTNERIISSESEEEFRNRIEDLINDSLHDDPSPNVEQLQPLALVAVEPQLENDYPLGGWRQLLPNPYSSRFQYSYLDGMFFHRNLFGHQLDRGNCNMHSESFPCQRYQVGYRLPNCARLILLEFTTPITTVAIQCGFHNFISLFYENLSHRWEMAFIHSPDEHLLIRATDLAKMRLLTDFLYTCLMTSYWITKVSPNLNLLYLWPHIYNPSHLRLQECAEGQPNLYFGRVSLFKCGELISEYKFTDYPYM